MFLLKWVRLVILGIGAFCVLAGGESELPLLIVPTTTASLNVRSPAADLQGAIAIAAGAHHTCAVAGGGSVKCWGDNVIGQLGNGSYGGGSSVPVNVVGLTTGFVTVAAGSYHTCALTNGGGVKCWGDNQEGELGNGATGTNSATPTNVVGLANGVIAISANKSHTCALTSGGGVKCWGSNSDGQLGDGTTVDRNTPVDVSGLSSGVVKIVTGGEFSCALTSGGGVKCWGWNAFGQLGDGTKSQHTTPVDVVGLASGITAAAAGELQACVTTSGGGVKCWGAVYDFSTPYLTPIDIPGLATGVTGLAPGYDHTCVLASGGVKCWGDNSQGQLGNGTTANSTTAVNLIGSFGTVIGIAAGTFHTCLLTTTGNVYCWGNDDSGQVGNGTPLYRTSPVDVNNLSANIHSVATGAFHTCALTNSGGVQCWGANFDGQLGDGTMKQRSAPVAVTGLASGVSAIATGTNHSCAGLIGGGVQCWGWAMLGQLGSGVHIYTTTVPVSVAGLTNTVTALAAGYVHTCALTSNGGVKCWGENSNGQLGDGTTNDHISPSDVLGLTNGVVAITAGQGDYSCALTNTGGVKCWGANYAGQLGDGTYTNRPAPVTVSGLSSGIVGLSGDAYFVCALTSGGGVKCWGSDYGSTPMDIAGLTSGVGAVQAGEYHTCVITVGGGLKCWGRNVYGELGNGTTASSATPVDVIGLTSGVTSASGGEDHTCAVVARSLKCWGSNSEGQLGDGTPTYRTMAVAVVGPGSNSSLTISHIEVTQATQTISNSVPLIAGKPTFVRVYVDCGSGCVPFTAVGDLRGYGPSGELSGSPVRSVNTSIVAQHPASWTDQRGDLHNTLNFTLPPQWIAGVVTLTAEVSAAQAYTSTTVNFVGVQSPRVAVAAIHYRYGGIDKSPDSSFIQTGQRWADRIIPAGIQTIKLSELTWDRSCLGRYCSSQKSKDSSTQALVKKLGDVLFWNNLTNILHPEKQAVGIFGWLPEGTYYYGTAAPSELSAFGDADRNYGQEIFAHEVSHLLGRPHTKGGTHHCENPSPENPSDWPYPLTARIDEWGVDGYGFDWVLTKPSALKSPLEAYDYMSYCYVPPEQLGPPWISAFNYQKLYTQNISLQPAIQVPSQLYFRASGLVYTDTTATLDPIWIITSTTAVNNPPIGSQYCMEAQNVSGVPLTSRCFDLMFSDHETGDPTNVDSFGVMLPYPSGVARIVLKEGTRELAVRSVTAHSPTITVISPSGGDTWSPSGAYTITWSANDVDGDALTYNVLYSPDGISWTPIGTSLTDAQLAIDAAELAGGNAARIRVLASDGVNTTSADSAVYKVGRKPPQANIVSPDGDGIVPPGAPILLQGYGYSLQDGTLGDSALQWSSDRDGKLGTGNALLANLSLGQHIITLTATDSQGTAAIARINLYVGFKVFLPLVSRGP